MKVLVVIDSFKGSLTSSQAEEAVAKALGQRWPGCTVVCMPISDGGEGMVGALLQEHGGKIVRAASHDPLMRSIEATYGIFSPTKRWGSDVGDVVEGGRSSAINESKDTSGGHSVVAAIEVAEASGLSLLSPDERNPLLTSTYGTGELIRHALDHGLRRFLVGLGGSATCDAGLGMMQALGAKLLDADGRELTACGATLEHIARIDLTALHPTLRSTMSSSKAERNARSETATFTVACDVGNPFTGVEGAARVFGPQKGADQAGVEVLERGMEHVRHLFMTQTGIDPNLIVGAGAAGGLGGALVALLGARLQSGIDLLMDTLGLDELIPEADLIITGEGKADRQTLMGKVPQGVLLRAQRHGIPVILLAGRVEDADLLLEAGFAQVVQVSPTLLPLEVAMQTDVAQRNIAQALAHISAWTSPRR